MPCRGLYDQYYYLGAMNDMGGTGNICRIRLISRRTGWASYSHHWHGPRALGLWRGRRVQRELEARQPELDCLRAQLGVGVIEQQNQVSARAGAEAHALI